MVGLRLLAWTARHGAQEPIRGPTFLRRGDGRASAPCQPETAQTAPWLNRRRPVDLTTPVGTTNTEARWPERRPGQARPVARELLPGPTGGWMERERVLRECDKEFPVRWLVTNSPPCNRRTSRNS